jgi:hypothetical protein
LSYYLDASVIVPSYFRESGTDAVTRIFRETSEPHLLSNIAAGEFASAVARRCRMGQLAVAHAPAIFEAFDIWARYLTHPLLVTSADVDEAIILVRQISHGLRLPDAIHLAVCQRRRLTLATLDDRLADAARAIGVAHIVPV